MASSSLNVCNTMDLPPRRRRQTRTLNYLSCVFCRKSKVKCLPNSRSWPQEKCSRCAQKGFPCSAPQRKTPQADTLNEAIRELLPSNFWTFLPKCYFNAGVMTTHDALVLLSVHALLRMAVEEMGACGETFLAPIQHDTIRAFHTKSLENSLAGHKLVLMLLERCIAAVQGPVAQNVVPAAFHLGNISRAMYEDDIDERSETIDHYEKLGHHGIAYVLQLQLANADWYPGQASRLIDYRKMFLKEWVSSCSHVDILEEMDLLLKCDISKSQLFIPKALLMVPSILEGIRNDGRGDCLGRSVSMIQHDAGICTSWPVDMLHKKDETGRSAAHIACYTEDSKLFQQILAFSLSTCVGEDIFWLDLSPLHIAATRGYTEAFRLMQQMTSRDIFQKALKQKGPETARTCLHWAASCGHLDTVIFICRSLSTLEVGDTYDNRGRSALHLAARHGHVAVVDFLCHRMNEEAVDVRDKNGCTSLWYAAAGNHPLAMESLAYFAKVNRKDKHGYTPLAIAAAQGHTVAVYHLLICSVWDGELDINTLNEDLNTPLDLATDGGHEACMKLLVDHGAVRNQDCDGMVPETRI